MDETLSEISDDRAADRVLKERGDFCEVLAGRDLKRLYGLANSILRNHADAEDAVQSALLLAFVHSDQYSGQSTYLRWMSSITINQAISQVRRSKLRPTTPLAQPERLPAATRSPEEQAMIRESMGMLDTALDQLPAEYASVFRMRELEWLSERETGARLGITPGCVKIRLFRARALLRQKISAAMHAEKTAMPAVV